MSNSEKLLAAIGEVKEKNIPEISEEEDGETGELFVSSGKKKEKSVWLRWGLAGCGVIAAAGAAAVIGIGILHNSDNIIQYSPALPKLYMNYVANGNGMEALMVNDVSEMDTDNPWSADMKLSELPVYGNTAYVGYPNPYLFDREMLSEIVEETARKLGLEERGEREGAYKGDKYGVDEVLIQIAYLGEISVTFGSGEDDGFKLPEGLSLDDENSERAALEYVAETFKDVFGFENPATAIVRNGRSFGGEMSPKDYYIYDGSEDDAQKLLSYSLDRVGVSGRNGKIKGMAISTQLDYTVLMGNYPIISLDKATELLMSGKFSSSVPEEMIQNGKITEDIIASAELVYRGGPMSQFFMPYYRFRVKLDDENNYESNECYGAFYVSAVEGGYLSSSENDRDVMAVAREAAAAYLRNDQEMFSLLLSDPNYDTGLSENSTNLYDRLQYMLLKSYKLPDDEPESDGVYSITYQIRLRDAEMLIYLDIGIKEVDGDWKVEYIYLQG